MQTRRAPHCRAEGEKLHDLVPHALADAAKPCGRETICFRYDTRHYLACLRDIIDQHACNAGYVEVPGLSDGGVIRAHNGAAVGAITIPPLRTGSCRMQPHRDHQTCPEAPRNPSHCSYLQIVQIKADLDFRR